jgi:hypothetical protein
VAIGMTGVAVTPLVVLTSATYPGLVGPNDVKAFGTGAGASLLVGTLGLVGLTGSVERKVVTIPLPAPYNTAPSAGSMKTVMSLPSSGTSFYSVGFGFDGAVYATDAGISVPSDHLSLYRLSGLTTCTPCPAGTYSSAVGATSMATCLTCVAGRYSLAGASSELCSGNCSAGYYCPLGSTSPTARACLSIPCPSGPAGVSCSDRSAITHCPAGTGRPPNDDWSRWVRHPGRVCVAQLALELLVP